MRCFASLNPLARRGGRAETIIIKMVQRRMVYASLWQNVEFGDLDDKCKLLYIGLLTLADDYGRLKNNPSVFRSQIFLYDENVTTKEIKDSIVHLDEQGLIKLYDSEQYLYHPNWFKFQILRKDRLGRSLCPTPDNQLSTKWQPVDGQVGAEVSKEVSNISKGLAEKYKPTFLKGSKNEK